MVLVVLVVLVMMVMVVLVVEEISHRAEDDWDREEASEEPKG